MNRILVSLIILLSFIGNKSIACSCDTISFDGAVEWADEIFIGHVVKIEAINTRDDVYSMRWKYTFKVTKKWKGSSSSEIEIYHVGSSCDPYFEVYQTEYLIYAADYYAEEVYGESDWFNPATGNLYTWLCARNVSNAWVDTWFNSDIDRLDKRFPEKIKLMSPWLNSLIWTSGAFVIIILIWLLWRRMMKKRKTR